MTLIKSISGIRGTIGGKPGENLTPLDVVKFTAAYGSWIQKNNPDLQKIKIVVGKDARPSGENIENIVFSTLTSLGIDVINIGLATTPTVEIAVLQEKAQGGIVITASHNPIERNALKLLDANGEFLSAKDGNKVLEIADLEDFDFQPVQKLGKIIENFIYDEIHIKKILDLDLVDTDAIEKANFTIAVDAVNSVGGVAIPKLLKALGVKNILPLYCEPTGIFPHNPEPLPENLTEISELIQTQKADLGIVVDPDVDRLALLNEDGTPFGEEYTLVAVADYILQHKKGATVSNYLSSRALRVVSKKYGVPHRQSAVGELNVVQKMKESHAVIGGEGNGGVIYPDLHYGRDALVGIALFLTYLAKTGKKCSELRQEYPDYTISKNKISLPEGTDPDDILLKMKQKYESENIRVQIEDGIRIEFEDSRVHFRKSNTEPIIRIYAEAKTAEQAQVLADKVIENLKLTLSTESL